jgi:hypothetical protein
MDPCLADESSTEEDPDDVRPLDLGTGFTGTIEGAPKLGFDGKCGSPCAAELSELS